MGVADGVGVVATLGDELPALFAFSLLLAFFFFPLVGVSPFKRAHI